jgi:hypothetical protein
MSTPVLLLGVDSDFTRIVYHRLAERFAGLPAIIEEPVGRMTMLRNRIRKLGLFPVASQAAFVVGVRPLVSFFAGPRIAKICREQGLNRAPIPAQAISHVASVNAPADA